MSCWWSRYLSFASHEASGIAYLVFIDWLLRPRKECGSVVMSMSVCVCMCVCLSVREDVSGTTRAIFTNFSVHVAYGRGSVLLRQDDEIPRGRGILGIFWPFKNIGNLRRSRRCRIRCKGIIQSPITPCSRRDHSVCQTSASGKILSAGNVAYRPGRGWWECTERAKSDIYDCLVSSIIVASGRQNIWCAAT